MRLFGVVITTRKAIMRDRMDNAAVDAQKSLRTLLADGEHPLRQAIVRVARGAAKDHISEWFEIERERFEKLPAFEDWARQQREHDLAEAEKAQPAVPVPDESDHHVRDRLQLRFGILGLLLEHGVQYTATIADAFDGWAPKEIADALAALVSDGLAEVKNGVYSAAYTRGVGFREEKEEARDEGSDSQ